MCTRGFVQQRALLRRVPRRFWGGFCGRVVRRAHGRERNPADLGAGGGKKLGNVSETPTPTTWLKSTAVHLQFVRQHAPHLYRHTFLASRIRREGNPAVRLPFVLQYTSHLYGSTFGKIGGGVGSPERFWLFFWPISQESSISTRLRGSNMRVKKVGVIGLSCVSGLPPESSPQSDLRSQSQQTAQPVALDHRSYEHSLSRSIKVFNFASALVVIAEIIAPSLAARPKIQVGDQNVPCLSDFNLGPQQQAQRFTVTWARSQVPSRSLVALGFERCTELLDPHPFTRKTPNPPEDIPTQKIDYVFLFLGIFLGGFVCVFAPSYGMTSRTHKQNLTHPPSPGSIPQICLCLCVFSFPEHEQNDLNLRYHTAVPCITKSLDSSHSFRVDVFLRLCHLLRSLTSAFVPAAPRDDKKPLMTLANADLYLCKRPPDLHHFWTPRKYGPKVI